ncbi:MAG TPA: hypothetical protein VG753_01000 [Candidatus Paceibacterota bacterium]|nr:hypothetical protein [Candidatus Paceibacterota bacterium]
MSLLKRYSPLVPVLLAALVQLYLIGKPLSFLITNVLPDDAFYYFKIAQNIAFGLHSTFDGVHLTDGYHPLWMAVLVGIYKVWGNAGAGNMAPIHITLLLSVALNLLTGIAVWRILTRFSSNAWLVAAGVAVWSLNPFMIYETLNGLETSLSLTLFSFFFLLALRYAEGRPPRGVLAALVVGIVGGLMILSRLDLAFYFAAWWAWLVLRDRQNKASWIFALESGGVAACITMPWFAWNYSHFHMLLTSASSATDLINHTLIYQDNGTGIVQTIKAVIYSVYNGLTLVLDRTGATGLALVGLGAAISYAASGRLAAPRLRGWGIEHALFAGFVLMFLANTAVRWGGRPWYFMSLELFLAIGAVVVLEQFFRDVRYKRAWAAGLLALILFFFGVTWSKELRAQYSNQADMYAMAAWMSANLPAGTPVGAFNSGVEGYFSTVRIVNLDGLVNYSAYQALLRRQLWSYIKNEKLAYISDWPISLTYRFKSFLDVADPLSQLATVHTEGELASGRFAGGLTLYHVK